MSEQKSAFKSILMLYLMVGALFGAISLGSTVIYYGFGPGAFWNIGFGTWIISAMMGMYFSFLRVIAWPYGLYIIWVNPDGFLQWLFYLWYQ